VALAVLTAAPAPAEPTPAPAEPMAAVGRLNYAGFRTLMHCTAALIAPDRALTAAHCLRDRGPADSVHFLPGLGPAGWTDDLRLVGWAADSGGRDVALLCLSTRAGAAPLPRSAAGPAVGETLTVVGYPIPRKHAQTRLDCTVTALGADGGFSLSCPVRPGASGAPVLRTTAAGSEIVGIVSATGADRSLAFDVSRGRALPACE
jgi:V8-like Glu-specific endopeptidase